MQDYIVEIPVSDYPEWLDEKKDESLTETIKDVLEKIIERLKKYEK